MIFYGTRPQKDTHCVIHFRLVLVIVSVLDDSGADALGLLLIVATSQSASVLHVKTLMDRIRS